jgi:EpsI family protein
MLTRSATLFVCFVLAAAAIGRASQSEEVPARLSFDQFPMRMGDWTGRQLPPFEPEILAVLGVDDYLTRVYSSEGQSEVGLYVGYYRSQRQGDTIHSPLNCLPGAGWEPVSKGLLTIEVPNGSISVNRILIQKGIERQLVLYWYQSHGRVVASEYWSKLYLIADSVRLNRTDAALVRVVTPITSSDDGDRRAQTTAVRFVRPLFAELSRYLPS